MKITCIDCKLEVETTQSTLLRCKKCKERAKYKRKKANGSLKRQWSRKKDNPKVIAARKAHYEKNSIAIVKTCELCDKKFTGPSLHLCKECRLMLGLNSYSPIRYVNGKTKVFNSN